MVVDEPMVGLDPKGARLLKDVLKRVPRKRDDRLAEHAYTRCCR